jgi:hypothetical protein
MKAASMLLLTLMPLCGIADWKPPKNPDPTKILREAKGDTAAKRYEDALAKHVWFHHNALKHEPALGAVRLSFALSYWHELGNVYPPALAKLKEIRDEAKKSVKHGENVRESFGDLAAINKTLEEESHTKDTFAWLDTHNREAAKKVFDLAQPALIKAKAYQMCGKYLDPKKSFPRMVQLFRENNRRAQDPKFGTEFKTFAEKSFTNECTTLVALLVVNERGSEAQEIATAALKEWSEPLFHAALEKALKGRVPDPWP